MNTEKLIVKEIKQTTDNGEQLYYNSVLGVKGTKAEMIRIAMKHNYGGGVELIERVNNKLQYTKL